MSRAITFRFGESARLGIMAEQGLGNIASPEIKLDMGIHAASEIKGNMESIRVDEMQIDLPSIQAVDENGQGFPEIRYVKDGVMTFIQIIIPNSSHYGGLDLQHAPVSEDILSKEGDFAPAPKQMPEHTDEVDHENMSMEFDLPGLLDFSLEPGIEKAIKELEAGGRDFSLQALEDEFDIPKSLPAHEDMLNLKNIMHELRRREKVRVKIRNKYR